MPGEGRDSHEAGSREQAADRGEDLAVGKGLDPDVVHAPVGGPRGAGWSPRAVNIKTGGWWVTGGMA